MLLHTWRLEGGWTEVESLVLCDAVWQLGACVALQYLTCGWWTLRGAASVKDAQLSKAE